MSFRGALVLTMQPCKGKFQITEHAHPVPNPQRIAPIYFALIRRLKPPPSLPREGFRYVLQMFYRVRLNIGGMSESDISMVRSRIDRLRTAEIAFPLRGEGGAGGAG